jgi:hypothetical protein
MNPKQTTMGGSRADNRFGSAHLAVHILEAFQETGQGARTDGDEPTYLNVVLTQFARHNARSLSSPLIIPIPPRPTMKLRMGCSWSFGAVRSVIIFAFLLTRMQNC